MDYDVIIVGGGLAGLACAHYLQKTERSFLLLEAEDRVGGRVRTDGVDGYLFDHGFQVLQTAYPEAKEILDYNALDLHPFPAGVVIRANNRFHTVADPRRHPRHLLSTATAKIGTLQDRLKMVRLAREVSRGNLADLFREKEVKTTDFLREYGFSPPFIQHFFVPFFAGATLDRDITGSSRVLKYIFRMFTQGDASLPAAGMGEIPRQLQDRLPASAVRLNCRVTAVDNGTITLEDGTTMSARTVVLALPQHALRHFLNIEETRPSVSETCFYFSTTQQPPSPSPFLVLNGDIHGPINNLAFPNLVAPGYAPAGRNLVAVVTLNPSARDRSRLELQVRTQLTEWFGESAMEWELLRTFSIPHALPRQEPPTSDPYVLPEKPDSRIRICGEHQSLPGIQWALLSGRLTAEAIMRDC